MVQPRDLVLLKLYAGGTHDQWDIQQLLAVVDRGSLVAQVEEDLKDRRSRVTNRARAS